MAKELHYGEDARRKLPQAFSFSLFNPFLLFLLHHVRRLIFLMSFINIKTPV